MRGERTIRGGGRTGEETTLSPRELNDEETTGELPEKEPVRQDDETTTR